MKSSVILGLIAIGLSVDALAAERTDNPPISFVVPGGGGIQVDRAQYLILVVETGFISHESSPVPSNDVVTYINNALKAQGASYLGVHIRQGIKFGEVVRALDELRRTNAKSIGVSMVELPAGKDP